MGVDGELAPDMEYELAGTPCGDVVAKGLAHIAKDVANQYPDDDILAELNIESYMGARICDSGGNVIGVINVFHTEKIEQPETAKALLEIFAVRVAIEMERIDTLKTLKANKALLNATLNSTADGLLVTSNNGEVVMTNRRFAELWRLPKDIVETGDDDKLLAFVLEQLQDPGGFIGKVKELNASTVEDFDVLDFKDGRVFERYSCPLELDGKAEGRVWSFRDITVKEKAVASLQESEDRYHSIFDSSSDGFVIFDGHGRIREANLAACRMHGWSEE